MCYKGKCLFCIPVEYGCLVFAVLSAIITLIALLSCIVTGLLCLTGLFVASNEIDHSMGDADIFMTHEYEQKQEIVALGGLTIGVVTLIMSIPSLIGFIFSVLLCNGICKRRPGQVKAYFIYGVVITVLTVVASIIQMMTSNDAQPGLVGLFGCVIYSLVLWMVFETYAKLSAGAVFKDHIRLVENS